MTTKITKEENREYIIENHGSMPVKFSGGWLGGETSKEDRGYCAENWWDIALFRTNAGNFVLATTWRVDAKDGKSRIRSVRVIDGTLGLPVLPKLRVLLTDFKPCKYIPPDYDCTEDIMAVEHAFKAAISRLMLEVELYETVE